MSCGSWWRAASRDEKWLGCKSTRISGAVRNRALRGVAARYAGRVGRRKRLPHYGVDMFGIIGWIIFGIIVGIVARLLHPGRDPGGFVVTCLLGIAGSLVAGFIGRALGWYREGEGAGFIMSVIGAILVLVIYHKLAGPR